MSDAADVSASAVPIWPAFVIPVLKALSRTDVLHRKAAFDEAAAIVELSADARAEQLKSGGRRYEQRISWALSHLLKAGWVERPSRGHYAITSTGRRGLLEHPQDFDYAEARDFFAPFWPGRTPRQATVDPDAVELDTVVDPIEQIESGILLIEQEVGDELLERLRNSHPDFFEEAVVRLLLAMGYGGTEERGRRIGGTGDGGVDGIIDQDALGLDRIYIQAKRYKQGNNIGAEAVQAFVGALHGLGASRGVFLTTSAFTPAAVAYTEKVASRVILIDGARLAALMIRYRVGVQAVRTFSTVKIDSDFFE